MLELARFRDPQPARLLVHALTQEGIAVRLAAEQGEHALYLQAPEQFQQARTLLEEFLAAPDAPRFRALAWQHSEPVAMRSETPLFTGRWWRSLPPLTRLVFVACVAVFVSPWLVGSQVYLALAFPPELSGLAQQPWRLLTPALLHLGALHIIFNLMWWLDLGRTIERFQSGQRLLLVTVVSAALSNTAQFLMTGPGFGGLSGVVYALLGYLWVFGRVCPQAGYGLRREVVIMMLVWLLVCMTGLVGNIANTAHVVGLLSGCAMGGLAGLWQRKHLSRQ